MANITSSCAAFLLRLRQLKYRPGFRKYAIGDYTFAGRIHVYFQRNEPERTLSIGRFCSLGKNISFFLAGNHRHDWITTYPLGFLWPIFSHCHNCSHSKGDIIIGNDVWIGHNATILSGVTIGDGAVIGTGAVVTKSIPPYAVAVGNPARVVRQRFDDTAVAALLKIQWWNWPVEKIKRHVPLLLSGDVEAFIREHG